MHNCEWCRRDYKPRPRKRYPDRFCSDRCKYACERAFRLVASKLARILAVRAAIQKLADDLSTLEPPAILKMLREIKLAESVGTPNGIKPGNNGNELTRAAIKAVPTPYIGKRYPSGQGQ